MKNIKFLILFLFINVAYSQYFEGRVTYKTTIENLNPDLINAIDFKERVLKPTFGKLGFMMEMYFYKVDRFMGIRVLNSETSFELYTPESKKLYKWKKGAKKGTALEVNENSSDDTLVKIIETNEVASIFNIRCKKITFEFKKTGKLEIWYNPDCFKMNKENFKDFKYNFMNILLEKLGCLPIKIKTDFFVKEIVNIDEKQISDRFFQKPDFEFF